jgi:hypothetical protein
VDVPRRLVLSRNGVVSTRPKVIRTLRFTLFISFVHPSRLESLSAPFISPGEDSYYKGCAARQKGLDADLFGLYRQNRSTDLSPAVNKVLKLKRHQSRENQKKTRGLKPFCGCRSQLTAQGWTFTCKGRTWSRNGAELWFAPVLRRP